MTLRLNTDPAGLFGAHRLSGLQQGFETALSRLGSGQRIQKAADDVAGMTLANSLFSQSRSFGQAMRNASDAASIAQVAEGGLSGVSATLQGIREKVLQAANASQSPESRSAIQSDIAKAVQAMDDIAANTRFNNQPLLSGTFTDKAFQIGSLPGQTVTFSIGAVNSGRLGHADLGTVAEIDVRTMEGAEKALGIVDAALGQVNGNRARLGSAYGQVDSTVRSLSTARVQTLSAVSTLRDVDFAEESMNMNRMKNLTNASLFAQAQGHANRENIFSLLMGGAG
ncbi:flagellin [Desulfobotulus sp.]|uniref:flagellin n=1 Tax=Desulfobotulus sp. TaxID=1940337 RepID=UPI002A35AC76|nr:flagellin [Desulfobotulus sp.]MDY0162058.1 flagellin [Desulfobotulus sp.]